MPTDLDQPRPSSWPLWASRTARAISPLTGGLLGFIYALAGFAGTYRGWYWFQLQQPPSEPFVPNPVTVAICLAVGAMFGGATAGLFSEVASPIAAGVVPAPFVVAAVWLVGSSGPLGRKALITLIAHIIVLLVFSGIGVLVGTSMQKAVNKPSSPAGIWWPHWLYFPVVAYYLPTYAIATLTNIWIDLRLSLAFTFNWRAWFWWKAWAYTSFFSWFAGVPTYILIIAYARLFEQMQVDSGVASRGKFNAFFLYFLTVPTLAWILTFVWRWAVDWLFGD